MNITPGYAIELPESGFGTRNLGLEQSPVGRVHHKQMASMNLVNESMDSPMMSIS